MKRKWFYIQTKPIYKYERCYLGYHTEAELMEVQEVKDLVQHTIPSCNGMGGNFLNYFKVYELTPEGDKNERCEISKEEALKYFREASMELVGYTL